MTPESMIVPSGNLSLAWAEAFLRVFDASGGELPYPLLLSLTEFDDLREPVEHADIRQALDKSIRLINHQNGDRRIQDVSATASTIFPHMCWSPRAPRPASELFDHYASSVYPRLRRLSHLNRRGTYFYRMIETTGVCAQGRPKTVCQLAEILRWWERDRGRTRRSAMQISLYDPAKDHNGSAQSGFPCLQQISFARSRLGLSVSAYYPTEDIFDRGYGNYLGLCQLGTFMAHEMDLPLARVNIFVALPKLGNATKHSTHSLADYLRPLVSNSAVMVGGSE